MEIVFWGATGQAKVLRELLANHGPSLVALFDNDRSLSSPFPDVPLFHGDDGFQAWLAGRTASVPTSFLVAIGGDRGRVRHELQRRLLAHGLLPFTAVHRTAFVADDAQIGAGSQILAQAAVCTLARLGETCIVNTSASVDHECVLGDGVHVCPGARLAGCVEVGNYATIGTGATVLPRLKIGEGATVGAGAVVIEDVEPFAVVVGNPARKLRVKEPE